MSGEFKMQVKWCSEWRRARPGQVLSIFYQESSENTIGKVVRDGAL